MSEQPSPGPSRRPKLGPLFTLSPASRQRKRSRFALSPDPSRDSHVESHVEEVRPKVKSERNAPPAGEVVSDSDIEELLTVKPEPGCSQWYARAGEVLCTYDDSDFPECPWKR